MAAWVLIEYFLGFHTTSLEIGQYSGYFSFIIPIAFIYIALHDRQRMSRQKLSVIDGINTGFAIALWSALILTAFMFIYNKYINPAWVETMIEWQRKKLIVSGASDDEVARFIEQNKNINGTLGQAIVSLVSTTGIGIFVTLVEIPIIRKLHRIK